MNHQPQHKKKCGPELASLDPSGKASQMRHIFVVLSVTILTARAASAQTCPPGQPASPWPGPAFVPTADCRGWVPANHPLAAPIAPAPTGIMPPAALVAQDIYSALEGLPATVSASAGGIRAFSGWAVDCALGNFPPSFKLTETKPDGSTREIPNDFFWNTNISRPDIQASIGGSCPAVYNVPASDGSGLGPYAGFGWTLLLRSPITEIGVHTFTLTMAWPAKGHSGAFSKSLTIVP